MIADEFHIVRFQNGVYDLLAHRFVPSAGADVGSGAGSVNGSGAGPVAGPSTGYDYRDFDREDPLLATLDGIIRSGQPDREVREYVLCSVAGRLDGVIRDQRIDVWVGPSARRIAELVRVALGNYSVVLPSGILTGERSPPSELPSMSVSTLRDRLLATVHLDGDEDGGRLNEPVVLDIVSGEPFEVRGLFGDPCLIRPRFGLLVTAEGVDAVNTSHGGLVRRMRVSTWHTVPDFDPFLLRQALIWLLLNVYHPLYQSQGLRIPASMVQMAQTVSSVNAV